jgi:phage anti-repressor protein
MTRRVIGVLKVDATKEVYIMRPSGRGTRFARRVIGVDNRRKDVGRG